MKTSVEHRSIAPLSQRLLYTFGAGLAITIIAGIGLYIWSISEWLQFPGPYDKKWEGYDIWDFLGLMLFTLFGPVAFCTVFTVLQHLVRKYATHPNKSAYKLAVLSSCTFLFGIGAFGVYWGAPLLQCGFIFCVDSPVKQWKGANFRISEAGTGFETTIGMPLFVLGISLIGIQLAAYFHNRKNDQYNHRTSPTLGGAFTKYEEPLLSSTDDVERPQDLQLKKYTPYNTHLLAKSKPFVALSDSSDIIKRNILCKRTWVYLALILTWILFCYVIATYIPNNWEYWYPSRIAEKARLLVTRDGEECKQWRKYTCPETPSATMYTTMITFNEHFNMKLFPSNAIFFSFITASIIGAVVFRQVPVIDRFLSKKLRVPKPLFRRSSRAEGWLDYERVAFFSGYEILMCLTTIGAAYLFFHYWFFDHNYNGYWPYENPHIVEVTSRTLGQVAVFFFSILLFPAARSSPILSFFGISWEAAIQYHRWLGVTFFVTCMGHMIATYWWYYSEGNFPQDIWAIPQALPTSIDNFTVPAISWIVWISIITIGVIAIFEPIRRKHFDLFLFAHHFTYMAMIPAIMWHAAAAWEYMLPGLAIWFSDRLMRAYRSIRAVHLVSAHDASIYSGERFHFPSIFHPSSIDRSLQPPEPIVSIHQHKSYLAYSDAIDQSNISSSHLSSLHALAAASPSPVSPRIAGSSEDDLLSTPQPRRTRGVMSPMQGGSPAEVLVSPSQGSLQSAPGTPRSPLMTTTMPLYSNNSTSYDSLSPVFNNTGPGVRIVDRGDAGQFIELRIVNNNMVYFPGHYAFINIAEISLFEWHPFTIASPAHFCGRSEIVFIIKTMGPNTWTESLYNYIANEQRLRGITPLQHSLVNAASMTDVNETTIEESFIDIPLTVSLDGPYGTPVDFSTYDVVILLGGGIGITPCKSIYESLLLSYIHDFKSKYDDATPIETNKRIHLMFSARDPSLFNIMEESLEAVPYGPFSAQLFCDNPLLRGHYEETPTQGSAPAPLTTNTPDSTNDKNEAQVMAKKSHRVCSDNIQHLLYVGRPDLEHEMVSLVANVDPRDSANSDITGRYYQSLYGGSSSSSTDTDPAGTIRKLTSNHFGKVNPSTDVVDNTSNHHGGASEESTPRVLVFVCGPEGMSQHAEFIAQKYGWDFHTETFAL